MLVSECPVRLLRLDVGIAALRSDQKRDPPPTLPAQVREQQLCRRVRVQVDVRRTSVGLLADRDHG